MKTAIKVGKRYYHRVLIHWGRGRVQKIEAEKAFVLFPSYPHRLPVWIPLTDLVKNPQSGRAERIRAIRKLLAVIERERNERRH